MADEMVVMVLTDVVGSTQLWTAFPDRMGEVMARHHAIVHSVVAEYGGWRPVDQGEGDAVFAAFESASTAVMAVGEDGVDMDLGPSRRHIIVL